MGLLYFFTFVFMYTKRNRYITLLFLLLFLSNTTEAQISYGGKPLSYAMTLRSAYDEVFQEMPSFDVAAEKRIDSLNQSDFKSSFRFAYKFMTEFTPENSGKTFLLPDGTKVWRLGIRSKGAFSLNILFSEYELPKGARLFLYSPDQNQILGSFNHLNNSDLAMLPVAPIHSDEIIIEYQEPAGVEFAGRLKVGEVNHGYRDLRGKEPDRDFSGFSCMPSPVCLSDTTERYDEMVRSTVLLIINGETLCTGALVNNTLSDGTPYLLTASHCLNKNFYIINPDYAQIAGTIVTFFNYESPFCSNVIRGTEELSMASALFRAVNEKTDMILLELLETPLDYYQPYYAGWNAEDSSEAPYTNIHHPGGAMKRVNLTTASLKLVSYSMTVGGAYGFNPDSHWHVDFWDTGSTAGGSSGSPLFDAKNRIVGALTGGNSTCLKPVDDRFYALHKSWTAGDTDATNLKPWLAPNESDHKFCDGFDPYKENKVLEVSNLQESGKREQAGVTYLSAPSEGQQFGVNSLQTTEYAESFRIDKKAAIKGVYFVTPEIRNNTDLKVEVRVYGGSDKGPAELLYATRFLPTYTNKRIFDDEFQETPKPLNRAQETFIKFDSLVVVPKQFFVGYRITALAEDSFAVYNLPVDMASQNTAWVSYQQKWVENTKHPLNPFKTSLFINPVLQYDYTPLSNEGVKIPDVRVWTDRTDKKIFINLPENIINAKYELFSIDGKLVQNGILTNSMNIISLQKNGIFIIRMIYKDQKHVSKVVL